MNSLIEFTKSMSYLLKHGRYYVARLDAPVQEKLAKSLDNLCNGFGPHYKISFSPDFVEKLTNKSGGVIVLFAYLNCSDNENNVDTSEIGNEIDLCSTASVVFDSADRKGVATLHNVYTHPNHRRQGLSKTLVKRALDAYDSDVGGEFCVLGTGSTSAAKIYQDNGFGHLAGGLYSNGPKGYNPEDLGEWIMVRPSNFDPENFYSISNPSFLKIVPVKKNHYAQLVLLFNAQEEENTKKFLALGITDGIQSEEKLVTFFQSTKFKESKKPLCYVALIDNRIYGIAALMDREKPSLDIYSCTNKAFIEEKFRQTIF